MIYANLKAADMEFEAISEAAYQIAVIDDEQFYRDYMQHLLHIFFPCANTDTFSSAEEMRKADKEYSFAIVDVILKESNGILASKQIQKNTAYILYYSIDRDSIRSAFGFNTIGYLLKTDTDEEIYRQLKKADEEYFSSLMTVISAEGTAMIHLSKILYICRENRKVYAYSTEGVRIRIYGATLKDIEQKSGGRLIYVHKSILANLMHIRYLRDDIAVFSNGTEIRVSRTMKKAVETAIRRRLL